MKCILASSRNLHLGRITLLGGTCWFSPELWHTFKAALMRKRLMLYIHNSRETNTPAISYLFNISDCLIILLQNSKRNGTSGPNTVSYHICLLCLDSQKGFKVVTENKGSDRGRRSFTLTPNGYNAPLQFAASLTESCAVLCKSLSPSFLYILLLSYLYLSTLKDFKSFK